MIAHLALALLVTAMYVVMTTGLIVALRDERTNMFDRLASKRSIALDVTILVAMTACVVAGGVFVVASWVSLFV